MKKLIEIVKKKIDWILIIAGSGLMANGIFGFSYNNLGNHYLYRTDSHGKISIGIMLLVLGILIYKEKKKAANKL